MVGSAFTVNTARLAIYSRLVVVPLCSAVYHLYCWIMAAAYANITFTHFAQT